MWVLEFSSPLSFSRHDFHKNCIDPWLLDHRLCPMCKMDILKYYGFVVGVHKDTVFIRTANPQNTLARELELGANASTTYLPSTSSALFFSQSVREASLPGFVGDV